MFRSDWKRVPATICRPIGIDFPDSISSIGHFPTRPSQSKISFREESFAKDHHINLFWLKLQWQEITGPLD